MPFARLAVFPGGTEDHHRAIVDALGQAHFDPEGRLLFAAGPTDEGWQILQIWERRDQLEKWVEDNLGTAFAKAGSRGYPNAPRLTDIELAELSISADVDRRPATP
jgi:hypothetical protein